MKQDFVNPLAKVKFHVIMCDVCVIKLCIIVGQGVMVSGPIIQVVAFVQLGMFVSDIRIKRKIEWHLKYTKISP